MFVNSSLFQLKSTVFMNLEQRALYCEDIGRQIVISGRRKTALEYEADIDAVTAEDLKRVVTNLMHSKVSISSFGDITGVPKVELVQQWVDHLNSLDDSAFKLPES